MNLLRRAHPGAGLTTAVVLLCGIVSGAALAAGNHPAQAQTPTSTLGTVPNPAQPTVARIPTIPGVPAPTAHARGMGVQVPTVEGTRAMAKVPTPAPDPFSNEYDDDALVLRTPTAYEKQLLGQEGQEAAQAAAPAVAQGQPSAPVEAAETPLATAEPFAGLNLSGLGFFLFVLLAGAGLLAYRKKQEQSCPGSDLTLEVASTIRVGTRWQVCLVRVPGRMLVLGSTDKGLELLTELYPNGDEEAMDELLSTAAAFQAELPMSKRPAIPQAAPAPQPTSAESSAVNLFGGLADTAPRQPTPRHTANEGVGAYSRPIRRQQPQTTAPVTRPSDPPAPAMDRVNVNPHLGNEAMQSPIPGHDDAFLDAVLDRLSKARPAVVRHKAAPVPQIDERAALRAQVKQYRRGPTRL